MGGRCRWGVSAERQKGQLETVGLHGADLGGEYGRVGRQLVRRHMRRGNLWVDVG